MTEKEYLWTAEEAIEATGGKSSQKWQANGLSIDSRVITEGDIFVALKGETSDGHEYLKEAKNKGAAAAIVTHVPEKFKDLEMPYLIVPDVLGALVMLAKYRRKQIKGKIIGITGSVGKTSIKEGITSVLSKFGRTHSSSGNFNNHIGMPLSMARMPKDTEFGIFEMGMSAPGEIIHLSKIAEPDITIVNNVYGMHLEFFNSIEDIAREKSTIFDGLKSGGTAIYLEDSPYREILSKKASEDKSRKIISFGKSEKANVILTNRKSTAEGENIECKIDGETFSYSIKAHGAHQAINSLAVISLAKAAGIEIRRIIVAIEDYSAQKGRGKISNVKYHGKNFTLIDDSYNAGPDSMTAAFNVLKEIKHHSKSRTLALVGDMLELGSTSEDLHRGLANAVIECEVDGVFTCGKLMKNLFEKLPKEKAEGHYNFPEEIMPDFEKYVKDGDVVLVKGSNGSKMWKISEKLLGK